MCHSEGEECVCAETVRGAVALVGHPEVRLAQLELRPLMAQGRSSPALKFATGVGSKADIDAAALIQLPFMSTPPSGLTPTFRSRNVGPLH